jgi:hypothetical protein
LITESLPGKTETDIRLREAYAKASLCLTDEQLRTLMLYNLCEHDYKQMQEIAEVSVSALRKRISRIKAKLKAITNINMGVTFTRKVETPEINDVLYQFFRSFKKNLEENTLHKMYKYFSSVDLEEYHESIDLKKVKGYELDKFDEEYHVIIVYLNSKDVKEAFEFKFTIKNNSLKVTIPPRKKKITVSYTKGSPLYKAIMKLRDLYPPDPEGRMTIPKELLDRLIKKYRNETDNPETV